MKPQHLHSIPHRQARLGQPLLLLLLLLLHRCCKGYCKQRLCPLHLALETGIAGRQVQGRGLRLPLHLTILLLLVLLLRLLLLWWRRHHLALRRRRLELLLGRSPHGVSARDGPAALAPRWACAAGTPLVQLACRAQRQAGPLLLLLLALTLLLPAAHTSQAGGPWGHSSCRIYRGPQCCSLCFRRYLWIPSHCLRQACRRRLLAAAVTAAATATQAGQLVAKQQRLPQQLHLSLQAFHSLGTTRRRQRQHLHEQAGGKGQ